MNLTLMKRKEMVATDRTRRKNLGRSLAMSAKSSHYLDSSVICLQGYYGTGLGKTRYFCVEERRLPLFGWDLTSL